MNRDVPFKPAEHFLLRAPLLPFGHFLDWSADLNAPKSSGETLGEALAADREVLRERLNRFLKNPVVMDALQVARPEAAERVGDYATLVEKKTIWWERKFVRLLGRLTGRAVPLGLFATVSLGRVSDRTKLALSDLQTVRTKSRPSYDSMYRLATDLEAHLRPSLRYTGPAALYRVGTSVRCLRSRFESGDLPHEIVTYDHDDELAAALATAQNTCSHEELLQSLVDVGLSREEAESYAEDLFEESLLRSDLHPPILDLDSLAWLGKRLSHAPETERIRNTCSDLKALTNTLAEIDAAPIGEKAGPCVQARSQIQAISPANVATALEVVASRPSPDLTLGRAILQEVSRAVSLLHQLTPRHKDGRLNEFKRRFHLRYGSQWVPLMTALDEEIGIGFPPTNGVISAHPPLIKDIVAASKPSSNQPLGSREIYLMQRIAAGDPELLLEDQDIERIAEPNPLPLPESFYMAARVAGDPDRTDWRLILEGIGGPSSGRLLARFSHADQNLCQFVLDLAARDVPPRMESVFAEVDYLPTLRTAFAFQRPRTHAATIDVSSAEASGERVPLSEILIGLRDGRMTLFAPKLDKEIIPRLTAAHNVVNFGLSIDRFLLAVQEQESGTPLSWEWGSLESLPRLPRVTCGKIVLRPAQWRFTEEDAAFLHARDDAARFTGLRRWRERWRVPRFLVLGSSELPVDLENVLCVEALAHSLRKWPEEYVREMLPAPNQLATSSPEGSYVHEIIVPFMSQRQPTAAILDTPAGTETRDTFPPGSSWLSVKVYCADENADALLCDLVRPVVDAAREAGWIDRWFFIRYTDPDFHLRLRFHGDGGTLMTHVLPLFEKAAKSAVESGIIWRFEIDTYTRASHTTGGSSLVEQAAELFAADSEAALQIADLRRSLAENWRMFWLPAVMGIDALLADFHQDLPSRIALLCRMRDEWAQNLGLKAKSVKDLNALHRAEGDQLVTFLADGSPEPTRQALAKIFAERSSSLRSVTAAYASLDKARLESALDSFIHLMVNRSVPSYANPTEVALYHLLVRYYEAGRHRTS